MTASFTQQTKNIIDRIEELIGEGNVRRIIIKDQNGEVFMEVPLLIGAIGTLAAPLVTVIGAVAGYAAKFSVEIIKKDNSDVVEVYQLNSHEEQ